MHWQNEAAKNIKFVFADELAHVKTEDIARRLAEAYQNRAEFNEEIRQSSQLQPEEKLWIVVP